MKYSGVMKGLQIISKTFEAENFDVDNAEISIIRRVDESAGKESIRESAEDKRGELRVEYSQK